MITSKSVARIAHSTVFPRYLDCGCCEDFGCFEGCVGCSCEDCGDYGVVRLVVVVRIGLGLGCESCTSRGG